MRPKFPPLARAASLLLVLSVSSAAAKTLYVAKAGDGSDGQSWETAYRAISSAVVRASTGDVILVSAETFTENIVLATPVTIIGGYELTETESGDLEIINPTGISRVDGNHSGSIFDIVQDATIERFTIYNGEAPHGGGVRIENATVILRNATIESCQALTNDGGGNGGGIFCEKGSVSVVDCIVRNNIAGENRFGTGNSASLGGGLFSFESSANIITSSIYNNVAHDGYFDLGSASRSEPGSGGGCFLRGPCNIVNALIYDNRASITQNLLLSVDPSGSDAINLKNTSVINDQPKGFGWSGLRISILNSIFRGPSEPIANPFTENVFTDVNFSSIQGGYPGFGNIDEDPLLVDPDNGDFRLQAGSPCIDSASTSGPATDLDGNPRPFDVPGVGTEGPGAFDMGAYEFTVLPTPAPTFVNERSDIDGNDRVDAKDLLILLGDWMKATGPSD